jgi:collagen type III alpha
MTSEGQQAGQRPAEATSGGPAEAFGPDGFPPDSDSQGRGSTPPGPGFPTSYAPPPQSTPNGGSPFVVPTVFGQPGPERPFPDAPADRYGVPTAQPGQASVPDPADRMTPPPFAPPPTGYTPPPSAGSARVPGPAATYGPGADDGLPQRGSSPFGSVPPRDNGGPPSAWAPPEMQAPGQSGADDPFGRSAEPHPYRSGDDGSGFPLGGQSGEIAGFAPGSPTRGRPSLDDDSPAGSPYGSPFDRSPSAPQRPGSLPERSPFAAADPADQDPNSDRPPGLSAFGDQRVRVPGATLTGLPDGPPTPPAREENGGGVTRRDGDASALPRRTAPSGDPLLSFGSTVDSFEGFRPTGSGRAAGGSADPRGPGGSSGSYTPRASQAFGASRGSSGPPADVPGDPFGRQPADVPGDPFGRQPSDNSPFASPNSPFGNGVGDPQPSSEANSGNPYARPSSAEQPYGRPPFDDVPASGSGPTSDGFQFGVPPVPPGGSPFGQAPAGGSPFGETVAGGPVFAPDGRQPSGAPYASTGQDGPSPYGPPPQFAPAQFDDPNAFVGGPDAQRVPGASVASGGAPVDAAESRDGAIPQPRDPADRPVVGTARPVSASASVPTASRVTPVDAEEIPPVAAAPQARVYGRPAPAADTEDAAERGDHSMYTRPSMDDQSAAASPVSPYGQPSDSPNGPASYGRPVDPDQGGFGATPFARPADEPFGRPAGVDQNDPGGFGAAPASPYARRPEQDQNGSGPFGRPPEDSPNAPDVFGRPAENGQGAPGIFGRPAEDGQAGPGIFGRPAEDGQGAPGVFGRPVEDGQGGSGGFGATPYGRPDEDPGRPGGFAPSPFTQPGADGQNGPGGFGPADSQPPSVAPQSPGRASGRATASARVTPPPPGPPGAPTTPEHYGEHTTDISRRGETDQPYVPAPALPSLHARPPLENGFPAPADAESPDRMRMGGVFPGPQSRGTVTPPSPEETTSWPRPDEGDQGRFDQFKPEAEAPEAAPPSSNVRMVPVIISVIIGAALVLGLAIGIVWLISRGSDSGGITVSSGECVKRSGGEAVKADCGDPGTFKVASVADTKDKCGDPTQPYVVNPTDDGKSQVLCLKPNS